MFTFQFSPCGVLWRTVLLGIVISTPISVTAAVLSPQSQVDFQLAKFAQSTADLELSRQQTKASHPKFIDLSIQLATAYSQLIIEFYRNLLNQPQWSRAQALQQAQQTLAATPTYRHPAYWSPFLLIGNWL